MAAGTQLGRYTIVKPLVRGGLAEVLLARATGNAGFQHHVVIKCIRAQAADARFVEMFLDEARLAASLHHHHIVQVHDVGREGDDYFFAMEYVHGENLRRLLTEVARKSGSVPLDQVITIVVAVAAALHHAHQQNIVHRDVTPANIIVGYDGNVKVCDFGIAKAVLQSPEATRSGAMRGKVAYMAPEQCLGRPSDRRSDVFSLGIVLYELCTSRRLFKGETEFLVMTAIVNGKIPKPTLYRADLPVELEDVILKALAPKPELRFATAEDFAIALERAAASHGIRISAAALAGYMRQLFGHRPEPWLDATTPMESVDVDFDGDGAGLANTDVVDANEFSDGPATTLDDPGDPDDSPTSVLAHNPFEANERTLLGEEADLAVLRGMSKIERRREPTPLPERPTANIRPPTPTPVPRAATPLPLPAPADADEHAQQLPSAWATPDAAVTATPMAWITNDADVPSLAPRGRRAMIVAALAIPVVAILAFVIFAGGDDGAPARAPEPDAFVESALPPDAAPLAAFDAAPPIDAGSANAPVIAKPTPKRPAQPIKKPAKR